MSLVILDYLSLQLFFSRHVCVSMCTCLYMYVYIDICINSTFSYLHSQFYSYSCVHVHLCVVISNTRVVFMRVNAHIYTHAYMHMYSSTQKIVVTSRHP